MAYAGPAESASLACEAAVGSAERRCGTGAGTAVKILSVSAFEGPSLVAGTPAIRLLLDSGSLAAHRPATLGPKFRGWLAAYLPALGRALAAAGPEEAERDPARCFAALVAQGAVELQRAADIDVTWCTGRRLAQDGLEEAVFSYRDRGVGLAAGRAAFLALGRMADAALRGADFPAIDWNPEAERGRFVALARAGSLDQTTAALVREAERRDIPWRRPDPRLRLVQFGQGRRLRRLFESATDASPVMALEIGRNKLIANRLLADRGLPVPRQAAVVAAEEAVEAAERIGYPVVVKPNPGKQGRGVAVRLTDPGAVRRAFEAGRRHSPQVLVEQFIVGEDHRILVVGGKVVAAARRIPGHVVGDGRRTVEQLVAAVNADPRRGVGFEKLLVRLACDAEADRVLAAQGLDRASVPAAGRAVFLRGTANISTGGTAIDVTEAMHPDNRRMAERAVQAAGMEVCGVDFLTPDIARSYREAGGAICELNAVPGLRPHWIADPARDVVGPIFDLLYPPGETGRIPVAAVSGGAATAVVRLVAEALQAAGRHAGAASREGAWIGGVPVGRGEFADLAGARLLLGDPAVAAAALETTEEGIAAGGLGFDWCDVAAVLPPEASHPGLHSDEGARARRLLLERARGCIVLAADAAAFAFARDLPAERICHVGLRPAEAAALTEHLARGGRGVTLERSDDAATLRLETGGTAVPLEGLPRRWPIAAVAFAAAILQGLGLAPPAIADAMRQLGQGSPP